MGERTREGAAGFADLADATEESARAYASADISPTRLTRKVVFVAKGVRMYRLLMTEERMPARQQLTSCFCDIGRV